MKTGFCLLQNESGRCCNTLPPSEQFGKKGAVMPSRKDTSTFIAEARRVHGDKYDYSQVVYIATQTHVRIVCPKHGAFMQRPHSHRRGMGCRSCAALRRTEQNATHCRFCGKRCIRSEVTRKCCSSDACRWRHDVERGHRTGHSWADVIKTKWHIEKCRQRDIALIGWKRRCKTACEILWARQQYKQTNSAGKRLRGSIGWDELCSRGVYKIRREATEQCMSPWKKKVIRICREMSTGRRRMKNRKGRVGRLDLLEMAERQQYRCALSGMMVTDENAELDHKIPVRDGGLSTIENLQWLHCEINRMKGAMSNEKFIEMCVMVVKHTQGVGTPAGWLGPFESQ